MPDLFGRATLVSGQHKSLRATAEKLRSSLGAPPDEQLATVAEFGRQMLEHFAAEERKEYFGTLVSESPRLGDPIEELKAEHREMAAAVRALTEITPPVDPEWYASELSRLLDRFSAHERREAVLIQALFDASEDDHE